MALNDNPTLVEIVDEVERLNNLIVGRGGSQTITPKTSNQTLNKGYYKGNITVKGDANLIASNILSGKSIFGVSGSVIAGKRWATGSAQHDAGAKQTTISKVTSGSIKVYPLTLSLSFTPSIVIAIAEDYITCLRNGFFYIAQCTSTSTSSTGTTARCKVNTTFTSTVIPVVLSGPTYSWIAIE